MKHLLRLAVVLTTLVATGIVTMATAFAGANTPRGPENKGRLLIISMPYIAWSDLEITSVPNVDAFMEKAAVGNLTTRTGGGTAIGSSYVTLGAGTRGIGDGTGMSGEGLDVDEPFGFGTAGEAFEQRTGQHVDAGIVQLGINPILDGNNGNDLDAEPGALGEALRLEGYSRAVIANADGFLLGLPTYRRDAVNALMGPRGIVPEGRVDADILEADGSAPFGLRLDNDRVAEAFRSVWNPGTVVLVETSDIVRAREFAILATSSQQRALMIDALRHTDELIGKLLRHVDLQHDTVMIVSPSPTPGVGTRLTVAALRGPGVEPGLLRSSSTRRDGFVQLVDIAPTVLDQLGLDRATNMQGRPMHIAPSSDTAAERRSFLIDSNTAAEFRTSLFTWVALSFIVLLALLALGTVLVIQRPQRQRLRRIVHVVSPGSIGFVLAVYLARLLPFHDYGVVPYIGFLAVVSLALGLTYRRLGRNGEFDTVLIGLGVIVFFLVADVATGSHLQFNSSFGSSASIGVRLSGFGNTSYAAIAASALLFAAFIAHRLSGRRGIWVAISVLIVVLVADGAPFLGSDVGGVLSLIPAFGITIALLLGARLRPWRTALICTAAAVVGFALAAGIDLARPEGQRTHLGRLVEQIRDEGLSVFLHSISNKLDQNVSSITSSVWGFMLPVAVLFIGYLLLRTRLLQELIEPVPEFRTAMIGFLVLAPLGYAVNDSGIVVPAMMLAVLMATLVTILIDRVGPVVEPISKAPAKKRPSKKVAVRA